jgi:hypothetical protein
LDHAATIVPMPVADGDLTVDYRNDDEEEAGQEINDPEDQFHQASRRS